MSDATALSSWYLTTRLLTVKVMLLRIRDSKPCSAPSSAVPAASASVLARQQRRVRSHNGAALSGVCAHTRHTARGAALAYLPDGAVGRGGGAAGTGPGATTNSSVVIVTWTGSDARAVHGTCTRSSLTLPLTSRSGSRSSCSSSTESYRHKRFKRQRTRPRAAPCPCSGRAVAIARMPTGETEAWRTMQLEGEVAENKVAAWCQRGEWATPVPGRG